METQKEEWLKAVKANSIYKEEDTVVPRFEMPKLLKGVKEIGERFGFKSVCYGHVGDGNLHVNIIKGDMDDKVWNETLPLGIREVFKLCKIAWRNNIRRARNRPRSKGLFRYCV